MIQLSHADYCTGFTSELRNFCIYASFSDKDGDLWLYWIVLHCTVLYCTVLYCTVLHCTVLVLYWYCTVLYWTVYWYWYWDGQYSREYGSLIRTTHKRCQPLCLMLTS